MAKGEHTEKKNRNPILTEILGIQLTETELTDVKGKLSEWLQKLHEIGDDEIINVEPAPIYCLGKVRVKDNGAIPSNHQ